MSVAERTGGLGLPRRLLELGRIRSGDQTPATKQDGSATTRPRKLTNWRITSLFKTHLVHAAELYGGEVTEWADAPGEGKQWQVYTETDALDVFVPPLAISQWWELWSGGGCSRRCDGTVMTTGAPCACAAVDGGDLVKRKDAAKQLKPTACKPMTRLSVVLPRVPGIGVWRVTTSSMNAGVELPGIVDLLEGQLSNRRLIPASLVLQQRTSMEDGKTMHFAVPVLDLHTVTTVDLLAGAVGIPIGGGPVPVPALGPGSGPTLPEQSHPELVERIKALSTEKRAEVRQFCVDNDLGVYPRDWKADRAWVIANHLDQLESASTAPLATPEPPPPAEAPEAQAKPPRRHTANHGTRPDDDGNEARMATEALTRALGGAMTDTDLEAPF